MFRLFFTLSILAFTHMLSAQVTTLFTNAGGDHRWDNAANWTNGIPTSLDIASQANTKKIIIPQGIWAYCSQFQVTDTVIVELGANITVQNDMLINTAADIRNFGTITTFGTNQPIKMFDGLLRNEGIISINNAPNQGLKFDKGGIINKGTITIYNPTIGINMGAQPLGESRKIDNKAGGLISILDPRDTGIFLHDTLSNNGEIKIQRTIRDNPNVPATAIRLKNTDVIYIDYGVILNQGDIIIDDSSDDGIENDGYITNKVGGRILLDAYDRYALKNNNSFINEGLIKIDCRESNNNNIGIWQTAEGGFTNRSNGTIDINGEDKLDIGIDIDFPFANEFGGTIKVKRVREAGIKIWTINFNNEGTIELDSISDTGSYGIDLDNQCSLQQQGILNISECYRAIRISSSSTMANYNNTSLLNCQNMGISVSGPLVNHDELRIITTTGPPPDWGISMIGGDVINNGYMEIDSVNRAIEMRTTKFTNNGLVHIKRFNYGFFQFLFVNGFAPEIENDSTILLEDASTPGGAGFYIDSRIANTYTLNNLSGSKIQMNRVYNAFNIVGGGIHNKGEIVASNLNGNFAQMVDNPNGYNYQFLNAPNALILFKQAVNGFNFSGGNDPAKHTTVLNNGEIGFKAISNASFTGTYLLQLVQNNGKLSGEGTVNMNFLSKAEFINPGIDDGGKIELDPFLTSQVKKLEIDVWGMAGEGLNNGHDILQVNGNIDLQNDSLVVRLDAGYMPQAGDCFDILEAVGGNIFNTYGHVIWEQVSTNLTWELVYETNRVILKVIKVPKRWLGAISNAWNESGNWENGSVPDENSHVLIQANVPNNLKIENNQVLQVGSSIGPLICKTLEIEQGANLLVEDAIIKIGDEGVIRGNLIFKRTASFTDDQLLLHQNGNLIIKTGGNVGFQKIN